MKYISDTDPNRPATSISGLKFDHIIGDRYIFPTLRRSVDPFVYEAYHDHKPVRATIEMSY